MCSRRELNGRSVKGTILGVAFLIVLFVFSVIKNSPPSLTARWDCGLTARANWRPLICRGVAWNFPLSVQNALQMCQHEWLWCLTTFIWTFP